MTRRAFALFAILGVPSSAFAVDTDATIKGVVSDGDGLPVPTAEVTIASDVIMGPHNMETDEDGRYRFTPLPPGTYTVTVDHPGFAHWESSPLLVTLGATVNIDVTLAAKDSGDVITVIGSAPAVDTESVQQGATFTAAALANVPTGRDYLQVFNLAAGVVDNGSGNPNVRGSFDSSNQYYIDGVNVTDPVTNTFSANMNYDAIDSIEVITGGMDAEYGRALGAALNVVTKSGGNDFEGTALFSYYGNKTIIAPMLPGDGRDHATTYQGVFNLGGPIVKDKAWFFASLEMDRNTETTSVDPGIPRDLTRFPMQPRDYRSTYLFGKVTWQPNPANRFSFHLQGDPTVIYNTEQDVYTLPSGETMQKQGGYVAAIEHQFTPNAHVLVETQVDYTSSTIDYQSILWRNCKNWDGDICTDDFVGTDYLGQPVTQGWLSYDSGAGDFASGEYPYASINHRNRVSAVSSLTMWGDFLGEHKAKIGVQAEMDTGFDVYPGLENGSYQFYQNTGDPMDLTSYVPALQVVYDSDLRENLKGGVLSWYAQDTYKPFKRLTLRPGIRFDAPRMKNDIGQTVLNTLTISPRFGAAFDLTGDGRTKIYAYYGRFYDNGFLGVAGILNRNPGGYHQYAWDPSHDAWSTTAQSGASGTTLRAPDLKSPLSDEIDWGFSREVSKDFGFDVDATYEYSRRFWEDDEVNLLWNADATDIVGSRDGSGDAIYRLRTPKSQYTKYTSLGFTARKQFTENWSVYANYTWSHAIGTNSSDQASATMDIPQQVQFEKGLLAYDTPHNFKISGSYAQPSLASVGRLHVGYDFGWSSSLSSGTPYRPIVWNNYYSGYNNLIGPEDGRYRLPMYAQTDLQGMLNFGVGTEDDPKASFSVGAEVFNVFNDRTITSVDNSFVPDAKPADQPFGQILGRQGPRNFQVVVRGEF